MRTGSPARTARQTSKKRLAARRRPMRRSMMPGQAIRPKSMARAARGRRRELKEAARFNARPSPATVLGSRQARSRALFCLMRVALSRREGSMGPLHAPPVLNGETPMSRLIFASTPMRLLAPLLAPAVVQRRYSLLAQSRFFSAATPDLTIMSRASIVRLNIS